MTQQLELNFDEDVCKFIKFLETIPLKQHREEYMKTRFVEWNLSPKIWIPDLMYKLYWINKQFLYFEEFWNLYIAHCKLGIEKEIEKVGFHLNNATEEITKELFYKGLKSRTYRTWASILTQIQATFMAKAIYGDVVMTKIELDAAGVDFQVNYENLIFNYQVEKASKQNSKKIKKQK